MKEEDNRTVKAKTVLSWAWSSSNAPIPSESMTKTLHYYPSIDWPKLK
jgi:hypothetical protein